jgi:hypothetical protein
MTHFQRSRSWIGIGLFALMIASAQASLVGCSSKACAEKVKSDSEARQALAAFLTSDSAASRRFIADLIKDGMRDESLVRMKTGCRPCVVRQGNGPTENPDSWYIVTSIAPREEKKWIVLEVECTNAVRIDSKLYGGCGARQREVITELRIRSSSRATGGNLSAAESEELAKALVPLTLPDPLPEDLAWFFRRFPRGRGKQ